MVLSFNATHFNAELFPQHKIYLNQFRNVRNRFIFKNTTKSENMLCAVKIIY